MVFYPTVSQAINITSDKLIDIVFTHKGKKESPLNLLAKRILEMPGYPHSLTNH